MRYFILALLISTFAHAEEFKPICDRSPWVFELLLGRYALDCSYITKQLVDELVLPSIEIDSGIDEYRKGDLAGITFSDVTFSSEAFKKLRPGVLAEAREIKDLFLAGDGRVFDPEILAGVRELKDLGLKNFRLTDPSVFLGLNTIQVLKFWNVEIKDSSLGMLKPLKWLDAIWFMGGTIENFGAEIFEGARNVTTLKIDNVRLPDWDVRINSMIPRLRNLVLNRVGYTEIKPGMLDGFAYIENVTFHDKDLVKIPDFFFVGITTLQFVDVREATLTNTNRAAFSGVKKVSLPKQFAVDNGFGVWEDL